MLQMRYFRNRTVHFILETIWNLKTSKIKLRYRRFWFRNISEPIRSVQLARIKNSTCFLSGQLSLYLDISDDVNYIIIINGYLKWMYVVLIDQRINGFFRKTNLWSFRSSNSVFEWPNFSAADFFNDKHVWFSPQFT